MCKGSDVRRKGEGRLRQGALPVAGRALAGPRDRELFLTGPLPFLGAPALLLALLATSFSGLGFCFFSGLPSFALGTQPRSVHAWQNHSPCATIMLTSAVRRLTVTVSEIQNASVTALC